MSPTELDLVARLSTAEVTGVVELVNEVTDADGVLPLSEHVMLHLRYGGDTGARHLLARTGGRVVGYGHIDMSDAVAGAAAELAVRPDARGQGVGGAMVQRLLAEAVDGRLRLWAHGQQPAAAALARHWGFRRERVLWQMRRSLFAPLPAPSFPPTITVRAFVPGRDERAWTEVNNRAFADHPDQGRWGIEEIRIREQEQWFDPAGFLIAERDDGSIAGFHWTKVHGGSVGTDHPHEAIGEVYIVGVDPSAQGLGLGPALTLAGLRHLRSRGLAQAMLYVDESNSRAITVYERLGFSRWDTDVCFARD